MSDQQSAMPDSNQRIAELEQALAAAQQQVRDLEVMKELVEQSPDGISIADLDGRVLYANTSFIQMSGFSDTSNMNIADMYTEEEYNRIVADGIETVKAKGMWSGPVEVCRPDGSQWVAQLSAALLRDRNGEPYAQSAIFRDVTQQQRQEQQLRMLEWLIQNGTDGVLITDVNGTITYANNIATQVSRQPIETIIGQSLETFLNTNGQEIFEEYRTALDETGRWHGQFWLNHSDGTNWRTDTSMMRLSDARSNHVGTAIIMRDVTQQYESEQERIELQEQVIAAQQATLRELSTPLIPLADEVIAMPLVGSIDSSRASQVIETLLEGIVMYQAAFAILDITGVKIVDTQVANALLRVAQAAKLLGTQVILTGIGAEVAMALTHLGADLSGIVTRNNLQSGIAYSLEERDRYQ